MPTTPHTSPNAHGIQLAGSRSSTLILCFKIDCPSEDLNLCVGDTWKTSSEWLVTSVAVFLLKDLRFRCCFMLSATSWLFRLDFSKPTTTLVLSSCVPTMVLWTLAQHCNWHVESHGAYRYEHHGKPGLKYTFMGSFLRLSEFCNIEKDRVGWITASKIEVLPCLLSFQHLLKKKFRATNDLPAYGCHQPLAPAGHFQLQKLY